MKGHIGKHSKSSFRIIDNYSSEYLIMLFKGISIILLVAWNYQIKLVDECMTTSFIVCSFFTSSVSILWISWLMAILEEIQSGYNKKMPFNFSGSVQTAISFMSSIPIICILNIILFIGIIDYLNAESLTYAWIVALNAVTWPLVLKNRSNMSEAQRQIVSRFIVYEGLACFLLSVPMLV